MKRIEFALVFWALLIVHNVNAFGPSLNDQLFRRQAVRGHSSTLLARSNSNVEFDTRASVDTEAKYETPYDFSSSLAEAEAEHMMAYQASLARGRTPKEVEPTDALYNASRNSFENVENIALTLLNKQPLLAIAIFVALGVAVAYGSGYCILCGYISSPNPLENGEVPYWDADQLDAILEKSAMP